MTVENQSKIQLKLRKIRFVCKIFKYQKISEGKSSVTRDRGHGARRDEVWKVMVTPTKG